MTQEEKELLIKDLCGRQPYGVKVQYKDGIFDIDNISSIYEEIKLDTVDNYTIDISEIKPYLFPLSSMTEEQKKELTELMYKADTPFGAIFSENIDYFDWLNKHHFDYRNLIDKNLAIDCTNLNIY